MDTFFSGMGVICETLCPTWKNKPLVGWRKWLSYVVPKRCFKIERERIFYRVGDKIVVSPENYAFLLKTFPPSVFSAPDFPSFPQPPMATRERKIDLEGKEVPSSGDIGPADDPTITDERRR